MDFAGKRSEETRIPRFEVRNGKLCMWMGRDVPAQEYDYAIGRLTGISLRKKKTSNGELAYTDFHFSYGDQRFDISSLASSCVTADLVSRLTNVTDLRSTIRIDVWPNDRYTNVNVRINDTSIPFAHLPRVKRIEHGFKIITDASERDAAVLGHIATINKRLQGAA